MIQKYCRTWNKCEDNPICQSTWPVVEIFDRATMSNDEILVDEEQGKVFLVSGGVVYESNIA